MSDKASSGGSNILTLNSYCLYEIFRGIKLNCENTNSTKASLEKYLDLINFTISCDILTKAFKEWNPELHKELRIAQDFTNRSSCINLNLSSLYKLMQGQSLSERKLFWSTYLNAIQENEELESVKVIYKPSQYDPEHLDRFEALVNILKKKKTLRELGITLMGYSLEYMEIGGLETLYLDARMDVNDLIQLCQRNPNLRRLELASAELYGRLSDIVPYCNHLEYLTISMKEGIEAVEYAPLARLPQLKDLTLLGEPVEGSLLKLLQGLKEKPIQHISIPNVFVTYEEHCALTEISSLNSLKWCPRGAPSDRIFKEAQNLRSTYRLARPQSKTNEQNPESVKYRIRASVGVKKFPGVESFEEVIKSLGWENDPLESKILLLFNWNQLLHTSQFTLEGWITMDDIGLIPEAYAKNPHSEVSKIELSRNMPITEREIAILASYPSIVYIRCYFHQLKQMIAVKLQQLQSPTFMQVDRIRTEHCEVRVIHGPEWVTLVLIFFEKDISINARIFAPLVNIRNLTRLEVQETSGKTSLVALFKGFASMETHTLQELVVAFLSPEELAEVGKISSLECIECGFFCSVGIEHLAALNHLEVINITVHPQGSLVALFMALASKKNQTLIGLSVRRTGLSFEEVVELTSIESLLCLQLGLPDKQDWEHSLNHRTGNLYVRHCEKCRLPPSASNNVAHSIHTKTLTFMPHEAGFDTQVGFLTELYETLTPLNLNLLAKLPNLRWLCIYFRYKMSAMENLWRTLALECPRRPIKVTYASQDFKFMSQFEELEYLECFFYHVQDIDCIGLLRNLKDLELHNPHGIEMWEILRELRELPSLQCLRLNGKDLDNYEMAAVANIKTLTGLRVGLAANEWFKYIILLKGLETLEVTSVHYANESEVDYINLICLKCLKLKRIFLYRYYGYITKSKMKELLDTISSIRNPRDNQFLLLRGIWADFEHLRQVYDYNELYLRLESITDNGYLGSDESDEESDNEFNN